MKRCLSLILMWFVLITIANAQPGGFGQNNTCETAAPFCTGTLYEFPAGVNAGVGQTGPCYGCLTTRPNPAWYYMKILEPGNIVIQMHSEPSEDIDFCCWGPFPNQNVCTQLTCDKKVSCSYSTLSYETCNIPNGQTGEYYILIITNYSNNPCDIIFEQTGGTGTTDCTILPPPASNNSPICTGQTLQLNAQPVSNAVYHWWGPANFTSSLRNPVINNATMQNAGDYFLRITVNGQPSQDTSVTHAYIYQPEANAGNDTSINHGVFAVLHGYAINGSGSYQYHWEPADKLVDPNIRTPQTVNLFAATLFTLEVTDDSASCNGTDNVMVNIVGGPLAVNAIATPNAICAGAATQLEAIGSGGSGSYTFQWTGPNGFSSTLPNPTVVPTETTTYQIAVYDGYNTSTSTLTVTVLPLPIAHAGSDKAIPNGTYTFLDGSVLGGTSNYFYTWSPADKLVNANVQSPQTSKLSVTTVYSLVVTDLVTNCVSNNNPFVTIEVTGVALNVNPIALPSSICTGTSSQLHSGAGGGNVGSYSHLWSSDPPGFTSTEADPLVNPTENTSYSVTVDDGFNTVSGSTQIQIYPQPIVHLGPPDTLVCIYDTVSLDASNPGATYLWSNGATTPVIHVGTTGIGYDVQTYSVEVANEHGCSTESEITLIFSYDACVGIGENNPDGKLSIFPNPSKGMVTVEMERLTETTTGTIISAYGNPVGEFIMPECSLGKSVHLLDLRNLPKGIYLIRLVNTGFSHAQKLVLE
jgi:hypothetical protein